ncbi:POLLEN OLE E 1 ALLERGEN AND EXTENSIN FAMILY PROTEIN [Salix koriyanagi]|uniref:POLLEN OLE E 1 ALLERGEN AND EXTENSIN FAMILY PROTEIN n=1 Tax=Salix koriyanagi TaxID=2511006 RepID=A0A9Q0ZTW7_9ROSI|nr:POLLEN OLE E 1 ALLERGEN AND EXTENSIN FAMILY PROTEIN [Salix koriyanagi]
MGALVWTLIAAASLLMGCTNPAMAREETYGVINVAGKVMCQDCTKGYSDWINGDRPIKRYTSPSLFPPRRLCDVLTRCKVSLTCTDDRGRVMLYDSDVTDERGEFDMTVSRFINGKQLKEKKCSVRLVSSPDPSCDILTDFAGGKSGVKLRRPTSVYRDTVKYVLTPFYFTSPMCDEPDTSDQDDDTQGNNH